MSFALHNETIKCTCITGMITGKFIDRNSHSHFRNQSLDQLLLSRKDHIEIYELYKNDKGDEFDSIIYKHQHLLSYRIFGEITSVEKMKSLSGSLSNMSNGVNIYDKLDYIILAIDYAKVAFLEYDKFNDDLKIICLYNYETENLSNGKRLYQDPIQMISSVTFNSVFFLTNDTMLTILVQKSGCEIKESNDENLMKLNLILSEDDQIKYLDTVMGENYFEPSFYVNLQEYGVYKVIKLYVPNKENEILDYYNNIMPLVESNEIKLFILYKESGLGNKSISSEMLVSNPVMPSFSKNKVSLAAVTVSKSDKAVVNFDIIFENLDQNSFDFCCLTNGISSVAVVFSPFCIQFINMESRISHNIILSQIYPGVFFSEYFVHNKPIYRPDTSLMELNLDLRGGGYLIISNSQFIFTTSKGCLYAFSFSGNAISISQCYSTYKIEQIFLQHKKDNISSLDAPYKFISMPHPGLFVLGSLFVDAVLVNYSGSSYTIFNSILNLSPIINFSILFDRKHTKFALTSGYDKCSYLNHIYEKFFFFEYPVQMTEFLDIAYIKSINFEYEIYSRYLVLGLKNGTSVVYEVGKTLENITDKILFIHEGKLLTCGVVKLREKDKDRERERPPVQLIVFISDGLIQIFNSFMKHMLNLKSSDVFPPGEKISKCRLGDNFLIVMSTEEKYVLCKFIYEKYSTFMNVSYSPIQTVKINDHLFLRYKDITNDLNLTLSKILKFSINSKEINDKYFLFIYRDSNDLEIYDLDSFISQNTPRLLLLNHLIIELPQIVSDQRLTEFEKDYERATSDVTLCYQFPSQAPQLHSFSTPEEIFFDILDTKIIFSIIFKNGTVVFYEVFFIYIDNSLYSIKLKKFHVEFIQDIDYKEFFFSDSSNLFIRFDNIQNTSGLLMNIKDHQKFLFDVNGKLVFIEVENNFFMRRNFSAFSQVSKEDNENGFIIYENGALKYCSVPRGYQIKEVGLIKRNQIGRFPVNFNYLAVPIGMNTVYFYILIEKELRFQRISVMNTMITVNRFIYFLTFRTEDPKIVDQIEFSPNEVVVESRVVELFDVTKNKKKYFALGVNIMDEKGEEAICRSKLQLYDIEKGKFVKIYDQEIFRGTISMIHSIDGTLIISEGGKIYLYQYVPIPNEMKKISVIDNKNLVVCSKIHSKFIITGDIFESASWIVFKQEGKSYQDIPTSMIYILGKDQSNYRSTAIDFWIDDAEEPKTGCVLADDEKNLHVFLISTEGGTSSNYLKEVSDCYIGKRITELRFFSLNKSTNFNYYSADDGSVGIIKPITGDVYDKLSLLCEFMYNHLPFRGGCNPKSFFLVRNSQNKREKGKFIDMEILEYYMLMPITTQKIIAKSALSDRETIIKYISDIAN